MKILSYRRFALWWQLAMDWFQRQFAAIAASIDFTPVEEKLDEVKSDVAEVKTAVEHIDFTELAKDSTVAKQGTNPNATNTAILAAFGNIDFSTLAKQGSNANATLTAILEALQGGGDPDIPEGVAERLAAIMRFFNITEATEYTALTPAEAIAIARDCQYNVMGTDWPIPTWLPTGVTEAQVESAAEGLGIPYHEPTQTA